MAGMGLHPQSRCWKQPSVEIALLFPPKIGAFVPETLISWSDFGVTAVRSTPLWRHIPTALIRSLTPRVHRRRHCCCCWCCCGLGYALQTSSHHVSSKPRNCSKGPLFLSEQLEHPGTRNVFLLRGGDPDSKHTAVTFILLSFAPRRYVVASLKAERASHSQQYVPR